MFLAHRLPHFLTTETPLLHVGFDHRVRWKVCKNCQAQVEAVACFRCYWSHKLAPGLSWEIYTSPRNSIPCIICSAQQVFQASIQATRANLVTVVRALTSYLVYVSYKLELDYPKVQKGHGLAIQIHLDRSHPTIGCSNTQPDRKLLPLDLLPSIS
eukprot:TRINITY_DN14627_c0_g1_i10.p1 TRINITY_DN14627_c0_g1~~TRINITY_DN14627_c0_g1_i10.p1  ORF type:complete len:156 (+),score=9.98 TRINITY_DN14627_c0_g1_i10:30-497(+)